MVTYIKGNDTSTFGGNIDVTGNVVTDAPAFYAGTSATFSASNATWTKVPLNTELFDTNNNFDATTNYRFTPTIAGYYQFSAALFVAGAGSGGCIFSIRKNGSTYYRICTLTNSLAVNQQTSGAILLYANGSTDYFELFCYQTSGGTLTMGNGATDINYMTGHLARAV